ncbi:hypothetical protein V7S43_002018 [Phytophthora oleae]|uniref:BED-type domain-containing protein n=1 Tax=Phytophthora oleae TaxID=2107226 RepID=A0ABD3G412_9STRA
MIVPLAVKEAVKRYISADGMELSPPTEKETSFIFDWGVRIVSRRDPDASPNWVCLATERCRTRGSYYALSGGKTSRATKHLKEVHSLQSGSHKRPREANLELYDQQAAETEKNSAKHSLLWDMDGVDGAKSSINVLLDWLAEGTNYNRWREADRSSRGPLVQEIMGAMISVNIQHRSPAQIWEKIAELENRYRVAENYVTEVESDVDEDTLREVVVKYFPHFYQVRHVMTERPPVRQHRTSDTRDGTENSAPPMHPRSTSDTSTEDSASPVRRPLDIFFPTRESARPATEDSASPATSNILVATVESASSARPRFTPVANEEAAPPFAEESASPTTLNTLEESAQTRANRPQILHSGAKSTRYRRPEPVVEDTLPGHNSVSLFERTQDRRVTMTMREKEPRLEERELHMKEAKNDIDVAIKKVQLECAQRDANVQLLLARKTLMDSGISAAEIDLLLPLPARATIQ